MIGHDRIIELRRSGKAPAMIFVNDYPMDKAILRDRETIDTVCTNGDVIQLLDMRFVVGLKVSIGSTTEQRAKALAEKCKASGAVVVAACHIKDDRPTWKQDGWAEVWRKENA